VVHEEIEVFFADRNRRDLLILYFSCHGLTDDDGVLYFAATNTRRARLGSTAISSDWVKSQMNRSRSNRIVLLLDCCFSGAFAHGTKGEQSVAVDGRLGGRGRVILTASNATEYSFEGDNPRGLGQHSIFTKALVQGVDTGDADLDHDGLISVDELYDYVYDCVCEATPNQTPGKSLDVQGEIYIARARQGASELSRELRQSITSPHWWIREGAVSALSELLVSPHPSLRASVLSALRELAADDSKRASDAATAALQREAEAQARREAEEAEARRQAEAQARREAEEAEARRQAEAQARQEAEAQARQEAEAQARQEAEAQARQEAEAQARREAEEAEARRQAEAQARREAEKAGGPGTKRGKAVGRSRVAVALLGALALFSGVGGAVAVSTIWRAPGTTTIPPPPRSTTSTAKSSTTVTPMALPSAAGALASGTYSVTAFQQQLQLRVGNGWAEYSNSPDAITFVAPGGITAQLILVQRIYAPRSYATPDDARLGVQPAPNDLVTWLLAHPFLKTSAPRPTLAGVANGSELDAVSTGYAYSDCTCVLLFQLGTPTSNPLSTSPYVKTSGEKTRFSVFSRSGRTIVFAISAPVAAFDDAISHPENLIAPTFI
jgi:hypothetical protein